MSGLFMFSKHCLREASITYFIPHVVMRVIFQNEKLLMLCHSLILFHLQQKGPTSKCTVEDPASSFQPRRLSLPTLLPRPQMASTQLAHLENSSSSQLGSRATAPGFPDPKEEATDPTFVPLRCLTLCVTASMTPESVGLRVCGPATPWTSKSKDGIPHHLTHWPTP